MSKSSRVLPRCVAACMILCGLGPAASDAAAQSSGRFYLSTDVGLSAAAATEVVISGFSHPTHCDRLLYADPANIPSGPECAAGKPNVRVAGMYAFDPGPGLGGSVAVGYSFGTVNAEIEFVQRHQIAQETPFTVGADARATIAGKNTEWSTRLPPWGDISEFRGRQLFANA